MIKISSPKTLGVALGLLAAALAVVLWPAWRAREDSFAALTDVQEIETLRARFNQADGHPRLILLVAPT